MQEPKNELDILIADLTKMKARLSKQEIDNPLVMEIVNFITTYQQDERISDVLQGNVEMIATVPLENSDSHDSGEASEELLTPELSLRAENSNIENDNNKKDNNAMQSLENEDEWIVIESHNFLHDLLDDEQYLYFRQNPTPMSEILSLYFFLKSQSLKPKSSNEVYQKFIQRCLDILAEGSLAFVISKLPIVTGHNYDMMVKTALEKLHHATVIKLPRKNKLFTIIDRHLISFTSEPLTKLDVYILKKTSEKNFDVKFACAQELRRRIHMHTVKGYYQQCSAQDSIELLARMIQGVCRKFLQKELHELDGYFRDMMLNILAFIDKSSTEHMLHVTNYRSLISPTVGNDRTNRVAHFSGSSFISREFNRFQLFNNAANSDFADQATDAFFQIMTAIENAERFIFIIGWDFSPQLVYHNKNNPDARTLGEILVDKAIKNPNLNIAIMVWGQQVLYQNIGSETHAQALAYLTDVAAKQHNTSLPSNMTLQYANREWVVGGVNSHHQKIVITDQKQFPFVVGFLGGLDLTSGRFDSRHELLLQEEYMQKYHQTRDKKRLASTAERATHADICNLDKGNPFRTPWHDIHCRIEGTACLDLLYHFRQHWGAHNEDIFKNARIKRALDYVTTKLKGIEDRDDIDDFMWTTQLLRSHTQANCRFWKLTSNFENSILEGYVRIINNAARFIYIENQYFIGGGKDVHDERRFGNLIPNAIFKKIMEKHHQKDSFHVYISLPLFPEGGPESAIDNAVRREQHNSMHWLIKEINKHSGNQAHRYITFLWNGEWNGKTAEYDALAQNKYAKRIELIAASRRYPIYVHSKFIIVDDRFVIIGSANINERSMMGIRDSEIAVLQGPTPGREDACRQSLIEFRTRLWGQYFGAVCLHDLGAAGIANPHTEDAIHVIQQHARVNLLSFMRNTSGRRPDQGHIMVWPYLMPPEFQLDLKKLPDTPLSQAKNPAYNWMLDKENMQENEYTSALEAWFGGHADLK